jgi:hypothetical protein
MRLHRVEHRIPALAVIAALVTPCASVALTLPAPPRRDNTLYENLQGSVSNGAGQHFFAGTTATGGKRRGVVAFTIPASVTPGTTVDSAVVVLFMSKTRPGTSAVALHRLLADWGEGTSDAPLEEGGGTASTPGDATWIHRSFNTQLWAAAGGDFAATASATTQVGDVGFYTWSSPALLADVQAWVDAPATNFGWLVRGDESALGTATRFDTRENPDPTVRPQLLLFFDTPTDAGELAHGVRLHPGFPNPFHAQTTISYELPTAAPVALRLLDARGRRLRTFQATTGPGRHVLAWDGDDDSGRSLPAGKYFLVLEAGGARRVQSLVRSR